DLEAVLRGHEVLPQAVDLERNEAGASLLCIFGAAPADAASHQLLARHPRILPARPKRARRRTPGAPRARPWRGSREPRTMRGTGARGPSAAPARTLAPRRPAGQ